MGGTDDDDDIRRQNQNIGFENRHIIFEMIELMRNDPCTRGDHLEDPMTIHANAMRMDRDERGRTRWASMGAPRRRIGDRRHHHRSTHRSRRRGSARRSSARMRHARKDVGESSSSFPMSMGPQDECPHHGNDAPGQAGQQLSDGNLPSAIFHKPQTAARPASHDVSSRTGRAAAPSNYERFVRRSWQMGSGTGVSAPAFGVAGEDVPSAAWPNLCTSQGVVQARLDLASPVALAHRGIRVTHGLRGSGGQLGAV